MTPFDEKRVKKRERIYEIAFSGTGYLEGKNEVAYLYF